VGLGSTSGDALQKKGSKSGLTKHEKQHNQSEKNNEEIRNQCNFFLNSNGLKAFKRKQKENITWRERKKNVSNLIQAPGKSTPSTNCHL
jgi:hypothetical protein